MTNPLRLLVMVAALTGTLGIGTAAAQTVLVRNAPAGARSRSSSALRPPAPARWARTAMPRCPSRLGTDQTEIDANVFVDICDKMRRVIIMERGLVARPRAVGLRLPRYLRVFWVRPINTLVVDFGDVNPTLLLIEGRYTPPKPQAAGEEASTGPRHQAPTGFVLFGGGGLRSSATRRRFLCAATSAIAAAVRASAIRLVQATGSPGSWAPR